MHELNLRNLPRELHDRLRAPAGIDGRSMSAEVVALLRQSLQPAGDQSERQRAAIEHPREIRQRNPLGAGAPPAERLVRGDRHTDR